ncbi:hypothetical protein HaLaN_05430 [Haematococcus lacustris]|uniref:Uncharacterized protein n=1 Tax=Haematococcus lacustris TaxID=44745 RepID=A0A699YJ83_HAELA|nr:hypothetical protein HaLaN_05430 [Haematococcus lacustris]
MAELSMKRHQRAQQLVVVFGTAGIGTGGGCGDDAVLLACCKVVCCSRGTDQRRGRVVLVDEQRTAVNGQQPCEEQLDHERPSRPADWKPPAGQGSGNGVGGRRPYGTDNFNQTPFCSGP